LSALSHRLSIALALAIGALLALDLFIADGPAHNLIAAQHRYLVGSLVVGAAVAVAGILVLRQPRALTRVRLASLLIAIEAFGLFVVPEFSAARSVRLDETPGSYLRAPGVAQSH
jgi:hydrogenase/urease accessory protein HupE